MSRWGKFPLDHFGSWRQSCFEVVVPWTKHVEAQVDCVNDSSTPASGIEAQQSWEWASWNDWRVKSCTNAASTHFPQSYWEFAVVSASFAAFPHAADIQRALTEILFWASAVLKGFRGDFLSDEVASEIAYGANVKKQAGSSIG